MTKRRCHWSGRDPLMIKYHDTEWGVPLHNDKKLFEFLVLDAAQAGLSWATILKKRENYRRAMHGFDPVKIAKYTKKDQDKLLKNPGIIRNKLKIKSAVQNAKAFLAVKKEFGSFEKYIWQFVNHRPKQNKFRTIKQIPARTKQSDAMSKDLKKRGFSFVGSTICYAFMQAAGMVNDHLIDCWKYKSIKRMGK